MQQNLGFDVHVDGCVVARVEYLGQWGTVRHRQGSLSSSIPYRWIRVPLAYVVPFFSIFACCNTAKHIGEYASYNFSFLWR